MQDEGPFEHEPPPTEEEIAAARAIADALDGKADPTPGSLAELARAAQASVREQPPLARAVIARSIDEGLSRRRRTRARVAISAFAAAAIAIAGFFALRPTADRPAPTTEGELALPALLSPPQAPLREGERTSERTDRLARLASADWLAAEIATARAAGSEAP